MLWKVRFCMMILAIDPGPTKSAYVVFECRNAIIGSFGILANEEMRSVYPGVAFHAERCVIEKIASYGMPVGEEVFETVFWSGIFAHSFGLDKVERITRQQIKMHLCGSPRAKDANIRQACMDRFGGSQSIKKGGPLYGVKADVWAALAVALAFADGVRQKQK